ncbi:hypothetical protein B0H11DRAFT_2320016 [Mycena galericulata]|nr:hypothetical protein B0H11DRAFT_2320016 [Mycena galericulata]
MAAACISSPLRLLFSPPSLTTLFCVEAGAENQCNRLPHGYHSQTGLARFASASLTRSACCSITPMPSQTSIYVREYALTLLATLKDLGSSRQTTHAAAAECPYTLRRNVHAPREGAVDDSLSRPGQAPKQPMGDVECCGRAQLCFQLRLLSATLALTTASASRLNIGHACNAAPCWAPLARYTRDTVRRAIEVGATRKFRNTGPYCRRLVSERECGLIAMTQRLLRPSNHPHHWRESGGLRASFAPTWPSDLDNFFDNTGDGVCGQKCESGIFSARSQREHYDRELQIHGSSEQTGKPVSSAYDSAAISESTMEVAWMVYFKSAWEPGGTKERCHAQDATHER